MKLNTRNNLQTDVKGCQAGESALKDNEKKNKQKMKSNNEMFSPKTQPDEDLR